MKTIRVVTVLLLYVKFLKTYLEIELFVILQFSCSLVLVPNMFGPGYVSCFSGMEIF